MTQDEQLVSNKLREGVGILEGEGQASSASVIFKLKKGFGTAGFNQLLRTAADRGKDADDKIDVGGGRDTDCTRRPGEHQADGENLARLTGVKK